jgi:uncharacterized protein YgiM (DUF1202 family)
MNKFLLSLWLLGAVLLGANTFIILGWPTGKPRIDSGSAGKELVRSREAPAVRLQSDASDAARTKSALGQHNAVEAGQQTTGMSAENATAGSNANAPQVQLAPPGPQATASAPAADAAPQSDQSAAEGAAVAQLQQADEWVAISSGGANVRSGPSSSASRLGTLRPGQALRVVSREDGWVQVASPEGSETGWIYERLLEPTAAQGQQGAAAQASDQPSGEQQQSPSQSERVRVAGGTGTVRGGPSGKAGMLFGLPEGRELRVLSRHSNWVLIEDPGSKQVGWIEESALAPAGAAQQVAQEQPAAQEQQTPQAQQTPQEQQTPTPAQRPSRSAAEDIAANDGVQEPWMLEEEDLGPPDEMAGPAPRPRKWGRRGRFAGGLRRALRAF